MWHPHHQLLHATVGGRVHELQKKGQHAFCSLTAVPLERDELGGEEVVEGLRLEHGLGRGARVRDGHLLSGQALEPRPQPLALFLLQVRQVGRYGPTVGRPEGFHGLRHRTARPLQDAAGADGVFRSQAIAAHVQLGNGSWFREPVRVRPGHLVSMGAKGFHQAVEVALFHPRLCILPLQLEGFLPARPVSVDACLAVVRPEPRLMPQPLQLLPRLQVQLRRCGETATQGEHASGPSGRSVRPASRRGPGCYRRRDLRRHCAGVMPE